MLEGIQSSFLQSKSCAVLIAENVLFEIAEDPENKVSVRTQHARIAMNSSIFKIRAILPSPLRFGEAAEVEIEYPKYRFPIYDLATQTNFSILIN